MTLFDSNFKTTQKYTHLQIGKVGLAVVLNNEITIQHKLL